MELNIVGLKYEINYNNKYYIIEANDYFDDSSQIKWCVDYDSLSLTKSYEFSSRQLVPSTEYLFDSKDKAIEVLKTYFLIQNNITEKLNKYKEEILNLKYSLNLKPISNLDKYRHKDFHFMSLLTLDAKLRDKGIKFICLSNTNMMGVQVSITNIKDMLLLEQAIKEIEFESDYTVVNYLADNYEIVNYSWPLYYYRDCRDVYIRQFAFIKKSEYLE